MEKYLAIVARAVNYRDHDRILTLVTREKGSITATARGCRKPKSKLLAAVQPFTYGEFILDTRYNQYYVRQCDIKEVFYELRLNPDALQYAAYITALAEEFSNPEEENAQLFSLLLNCLKYLCEPDNAPIGVCVFFIAKLLLFSGYRPCMDECVRCGRVDELIYFSSEEGGVLCPKCSREVAGARPIKTENARIIDSLATVPNAAYAAVRELLDGKEKQLFGILSGYIKDRTGKKLPTLYERYL